MWWETGDRRDVFCYFIGDGSAGGVNYSYDGDGRRVSKSNGRNYFYGGGSAPIVELDGNSNPLRRHYYFDGVRVASGENPGVNSWVDHYFYDALGNSRSAPVHFRNSICATKRLSSLSEHRDLVRI